MDNTENKRLGHVLQAVQIVQELRDNRRSGPSRTNRTGQIRQQKAGSNKKAQRGLDASDLAMGIAQANQRHLAGTTLIMPANAKT